MIRDKLLLKVVCVLTICSFLIFHAGCTKKDEQQAAETEEKGRIEQMTDKAADEAVRKIRTPINKARNTKDYGDDRMEAMDKALQQQ